MITTETPELKRKCLRGKNVQELSLQGSWIVLGSGSASHRKDCGLVEHKQVIAGLCGAVLPCKKSTSGAQSPNTDTQRWTCGEQMQCCVVKSIYRLSTRKHCEMSLNVTEELPGLDSSSSQSKLSKGMAAYSSCTWNQWLVISKSQKHHCCFAR